MVKVISVKFKEVGKKYFFEAPEIEIHDKDKIVVETVRGFELATVVGEKKEIDESELFASLKPIVRMATKEDIEAYNQNKELEKEAQEKVEACVKESDLEMKILGCEYTLDRTKLMIYFTAEGRVDFRELVKVLASIFRVRIELRQVGTRDGAKFIGGIGPCGLILCCNTFLGEFDAVSIKMAKNQNLSLNPSSISGLCDKILCCIKYENDYYTDAREVMPIEGTYVNTPEGKGRVLKSYLMRKEVLVELETGGVKEFKNTDIKFKKKMSEDTYVENLKELHELE